MCAFMHEILDIKLKMCAFMHEILFYKLNFLHSKLDLLDLFFISSLIYVFIGSPDTLYLEKGYYFYFLSICLGNSSILIIHIS